MLKPRDVIASEANRHEVAHEERTETKAKARQEASLRKLADALAQRPEGDTLSGLADLAGMSRKRAREAVDELLERGTVSTCTVIKGRGQRENEGYRLANSAVKTSSTELTA